MKTSIARSLFVAATILALSSLALSSPAGAASIVLTETSSAEIIGGLPNTAFPNYVAVFLQQYSLLDFNLTSIPATSTITSAILSLGPSTETLGAGNSAGIAGDSKAAAAAKSWDSSATWNSYSTVPSTLPWTAAGGDIVAGTVVNSNAPVLGATGPGGTHPSYTLSYDVTNIAQQWHSGALTNDGFLITNNGNVQLIFLRGTPGGTDSMGNTGFLNSAPTLTITYSTPEPTSVVLLAAGAVGLLHVARRRRGSQK